MCDKTRALRILAEGLQTLEQSEREAIVTVYWCNQELNESQKIAYESGLKKLEPFIEDIGPLDD